MYSRHTALTCFPSILPSAPFQAPFLDLLHLSGSHEGCLDFHLSCHSLHTQYFCTFTASGHLAPLKHSSLFETPGPAPSIPAGQWTRKHEEGIQSLQRLEVLSTARNFRCSALAVAALGKCGVVVRSLERGLANNCGGVWCCEVFRKRTC